MNPAVVKAVINPLHWQANDHLIHLCKPLVDAIGNLESRDITLADCMLELIDLVENGSLLASTIDEEHFAFLNLIYIIFFIAILVCVELKYNTRSCSYCLEFISFH